MMQTHKITPLYVNNNLSKVIKEQSTSLRRSFYLILSIWEKGQSYKAISVYRQLLTEAKKNPAINAEYAFCHLTAIAQFTYDGSTAEQSRMRQKLLSSGPYLEAHRLRVESIKDLPHSPEVWIMASMYYAYLGQWHSAISSAKNGVEIDPKWGYAHYVLGKSIRGQNSDIKDPSEKEKNARTAIKEFKTAQSLEQGVLMPNINYEFTHAYTEIGDIKKAVEYLDKIIQTSKKNHESSEKISRLQSWRSSLYESLKNQRAR
jgi:tetratricopeptide (TPR) repeat protein